MSQATDAKTTPRRRRRWLRRTSKGLGTLVLLLLAVVLLVVHSLDRPWVKGRLQHLVAAASGFEIDYASTRVSVFSGLEIDEVVVASPPAFRATAPSLVRVGRVSVSWSVRSLLRARVLEIRLTDIAVTLVDDPELGWSVAPKAAAAPVTEAGPMVPLSRRLHELLLAAPPLTEMTVEKLTLTVIRPGSRLTLGGLWIRAEVDQLADGWRTAVRFGSSAKPLGLRLTGTETAAARLWGQAGLTPAGASVRIELDQLAQGWNARLPSSGLSLDAAAFFEPAKHQVRVELAKLDLLGGTAKADASVTLFDDDVTGGIAIRKTNVDADLGRALGFVDGLGLPVKLESGQLHARVANLALGVPGGPIGEATATVESELRGVTLASPPVSVADAWLVLKIAPPTETPRVTVKKGLRHAAAALLDALQTRGDLTLRGVHARLDGRSIESDQIVLDLAGRLGSPSEWTGDVGVRSPSLKLTGPESLALDNLAVSVGLGRLRLDRTAQFGVRGEVHLVTKLPSLKLTRAGLRVAGDLTLGAKTSLGVTPIAVALDLDGNLSVEDGHRLFDGPIKLTLGLGQVVLEPTAWARSRAVATVDLVAARAHTVLHATKHADAVDYDLAVDAASLGAARPWLPAGRDLNIDQMGLVLGSKGHVDHLRGGVELRHHTELGLRHVKLDRTLADQLSLTLDSSGTLARHTLDGTIDLKGLVVGSTQVGDGHIALGAKVDLPAATLALHVAAHGPAAPKLSLDAKLGFDRDKRALDFDLDGQLGHLQPLSTVADGIAGLRDFDLESLALGLKAKGSLTGVIQSVDGQGHAKLAPDPSATLGGAALVQLGVKELSWSVAEHGLYTPTLTWRGQLRTSDGRRSLDGDLALDRLSVVTGSHEIEVRGIRDTVALGLTGPLSTGEVTLLNTLHADTVTQDFQRHYRVGDLGLHLDAKRDRDGVIRLGEFKLTNGAGGTSLRSTGAIEILGERRSMAINTALEQDLARLSDAPQTLGGHGKVALGVRIGSGNLHVFRARGSLKITDGGVSMPAAGILAESIDADIPFAADVTFADGKVAFLRDLDINPYSERRFADQHPLLGRHSYLSVKKLVTPFFSAAPLAGNLQIEQNIFQLNQLDMGVRSGRITGQCVLDWNRDDPNLQLHVRASHVMSSHDEPFDGNAAVQISVRRRSIDGRAEILRIGRRHLLDLLDLADPHHTEAPINRIRRTLALGYPDRLRLTFERGFAAARVTFAGLASLVSLDEIRGIPMGPLVDKLLAPLDDAEEGE